MNGLLAGQASTEHISTSSVTLNTGVVTDMSNDADINSSRALLDSAEAQHPHQQVDFIAPSQLVLQATLVRSRTKTQGSETPQDTQLLVKYLDLVLDDRATLGIWTIGRHRGRASRTDGYILPSFS